MRWLTLSILLANALCGVSGHLLAAEPAAATQDGRPFATLGADALSALSAADQQAYRTWQQALPPPVTTSTYQEETGPNSMDANTMDVNTMDLSADFSM